MSKSHKEVMAEFKTQSNTLSQMAESFPDHAAHATSMLEKLRVVELCVSQAAEKIEWIKIGVAELQEMKKGRLASLGMDITHVTLTLCPSADLAAYYADNLHGQALEWLSPIDPSARHDEIRASRVLGTCEWILDNSEFRKWSQLSPSSDYNGVNCWVGDPGQGKTYTMWVLLSKIIDSSLRTGANHQFPEY